MEELKVYWENIGLDSDLVSELFYQIYYMGIYKAPGEDKIVIPGSDIPEPIPPIDPSKKEGSFSDDFDLSFAI